MAFQLAGDGATQIENGFGVLPLQAIAHRILADGTDARAEHTFTTLRLDAGERTALAGAAQEDGIENCCGGNAGKVAAGRASTRCEKSNTLSSQTSSWCRPKLGGACPLSLWLGLPALQQAAQIDSTNGIAGLLKTLMEFDPAADLLDQLGENMKGPRYSLEYNRQQKLNREMLRLALGTMAVGPATLVPPFDKEPGSISRTAESLRRGPTPPCLHSEGCHNANQYSFPTRPDCSVSSRTRSIGRGHRRLPMETLGISTDLIR